MADYSPTRIPDSVKERFWAKVDKRGPDECWPWRERLNRKGYGSFAVRGHGYNASRFSLVLASGFEPDRTLHACHSCDNPKCCNPAHLRWATHAENMRDAVERGRLWGKGAKTHCFRGHETTPENMYYRANGQRKSCKHARQSGGTTGARN